MKSQITLILALISFTAFGQSNLTPCHGDDQEKRNGCLSSENSTTDLKQDDEMKEETKIYILVDDVVIDSVDDYQKRSNLKFDKKLNFPDPPRGYKYKRPSN